MANVLCRWHRDVLVRFAKQGNFELGHAVDAVEEAEEIDSHARATECAFEFLHIFEGSSVLLALGHIAAAALIIAESIPCKSYHFFVAARKQADAEEHLSKKAGGVGATGKAKDVNQVTFGIVPHDEAITG